MSSARMRQGQAAARRGRFEEAKTIFLGCIDDGELQGYAEIGHLYVRGNGVTKDYDEARNWYERGIAAGDARSLCLMGSLYANGNGVTKSYVEARRWYLRGVARGDSWSMTNLGALYWRGQGVAKDRRQAARWYRKAAARGDSTAMDDIGRMYRSGEGVRKDFKKAMHWHRRALDSGDGSAAGRARFSIGVLYHDGCGVDQDYVEAARWYRDAIDHDSASALRNLGLLYALGLGVPQSYAEAMRWYEKAVERDVASAAYSIGILYGAGHGVPIDHGEAMRWYRRAIELDETLGDAYNNIGALYVNGEGVLQDKSEGMRWYLRGVENGSAQAMYNLGHLAAEGYRTGGSGNDRAAESIGWFRRAAALGHTDAIEALRKVGASYTAPAAEGASSSAILTVVVLAVAAIAASYYFYQGGARDEASQQASVSEVAPAEEETGEAYTIERYVPYSPLVVRADNVAIHSEPSDVSPIIELRRAGTPLAVSGRVFLDGGQTWIAITTSDGRTGFVLAGDTMLEREFVGDPPPPVDDVFAYGPAPPLADAPLTIDNPDWTARPNARDFTRHYPRRALRAERSGRVVLDCLAEASGAVSCTVSEETPPGWGFGEAALELSHEFRLRPQMEDGRSVAGGRVRIPMTFRVS